MYAKTVGIFPDTTSFVAFLTKIHKLQSHNVCLKSSQTQGTIASGELHVINHLFVDNIIAKPIFNNPEWDYGDVFNRPCYLFVRFNEVKAVDGMARVGGEKAN